MRCMGCDSCKKGWFTSRPNDYVCVGVKEPFVIEDVNAECTEYPEKRDAKPIQFCESYKSLYKHRLTKSIDDYCARRCGKGCLFKCDVPCFDYEVYHRLKVVEDLVFGEMKGQ